MNTELLQAAEELAAPDAPDGVTQLGLGGAVILRRLHPSGIEGTVYGPLICLILQGAKEVTAGVLSVHCPAGHAILVSHDLPVLSRITEASPEEPYVAVVLPIDLGLLRGFFDQMPDVADGDADAGALRSCAADRDLLGAFARLLVLAHGGIAAPVLGQIIVREIHARLLFSAQGAVLRRFLRREDPSNQVARAIASIRASIDEPLSVPALAERARMSKSSFHAHFKAVTGLTPGQYQKDIRLLEARRLILETGEAISAVAFRIGYESPAQFSRDYARKYGRAPRDDRNRERGAYRAQPAAAAQQGAGRG